MNPRPDQTSTVPPTPPAPPDLVETATTPEARELHRLRRLYAALGRVHQALLGVRSREALFSEACRLTHEMAGFRFVWIGWLDPVTREVRPVGRYGRDSELLDQIRVRADDAPEGRGAIGTCLREGRPCFLNHMLSDPRGQPWLRFAAQFGLQAVAALPIHLGGAVCGAIAVYSEEADVFRDEEIALLEGIAADISYALDVLEQTERHREAENALSRSDRSLRRAQAIAQLEPWTGDFATGTFRATHDVPTQLGLPPGPHSFEAVIQVAHPEDRERIRSAWQAALGGAPYEIEHRILVRGQVHWLHVRAEIEFDRNGKPLTVTGISQDITDRKRTERRLAIQHAVSHVLAEAQSLRDATPRLLQTLCEADGWEFAALWEVDPRNHVLRANDAWAAPGLPLGELANQTRDGSFAPGVGLPGRVWITGRPVFVADMARDPSLPRGPVAAQAGLRTAFGFPVRLREGITGVIDFLGRSRGEPDAALVETLEAVGRQIGQFIDRQRAQEQLQRFLSVSPAVLYALKIETTGLRFLWVSDNVGDVTGYPGDTRFNRAWWIAAIHPEDRTRVLATQPHPYTLAETVVEYRFRRADGVYRWLRDERRLLRDAHGQPSEVIGTWVDITRRVELEAQLRQSQKMESLGQLSGGIAHDFNNLLAIILGNIQLLRMDLAADHPAQSCIDEIYEAGGRARTLIEQILAFSRRQPPERRIIDLRPVVEQGVRMLRSIIPASVEIITEIEPGLPWVSADSNQIHQVLLNLGTNAWHALGGHPGRLEISLRPVDLDAAAAARRHGLRPGPHLRLTARDNGQGMDAATRERIFDPFFTTKAPGVGTGLGLSVVHGIVQAHEGAIEVESEPGHGALFSIYLPAVPAATEPAALAPHAPRSARPGRGERILFLDDEASVAQAGGKMLERIGYRVSAFTRPEDALEAVRQNPDQFDLMITDFNMPGVSGLDIAAAVLQLRPNLPILLNSGYVSPELVTEAKRIGIHDVLQKPNTIADLSDSIHQAIASGTGATPGVP